MNLWYLIFILVQGSLNLNITIGHLLNVRVQATAFNYSLPEATVMAGVKGGVSCGIPVCMARNAKVVVMHCNVHCTEGLIEFTELLGSVIFIFSSPF